jgi:hypothetical protein
VLFTVTGERDHRVDRADIESGAFIPCSFLSAEISALGGTTWYPFQLDPLSGSDLPLLTGQCLRAHRVPSLPYQPPEANRAVNGKQVHYVVENEHM